MLFSQAHRTRSFHENNRTVQRSGSQATVPTTQQEQGFKMDRCCSTLPILKMLEIGFSLVTILLNQPIAHVWYGYAYMLFVAASGALTTMLLLIIFLCSPSHSILKDLPYRKMDISSSILFVLLFLVAWVLSCYDCVMQFENNNTHHQYPFPDGSIFIHWRNRLLAVTVICALNAILYVASAIVARKQ